MIKKRNKNQPPPPPPPPPGWGKTPNLNEIVFIGCSKFFFFLFDWLWSSNEEFLYEENVEFLGEFCQNFPKTNVFVLTIT